MGKKKKEKIGRVQSKRSKTESATHTIKLLYWTIMLIFALTLFITLAIVMAKILPMLEKLDDITNSTTSNIATYSNLIIALIIVWIRWVKLDKKKKVIKKVNYDKWKFEKFY